MPDINPAAPQPFSDSASADAFYGAAYADETKAAPAPPLDSNAAKMWPKDGGDPSKKDHIQLERSEQPAGDEERPEDSEQQLTDEELQDDALARSNHNLAVDLRDEFDTHVGELGIDSTSAQKLYAKMAPVIQAQQAEAMEDCIDRWSDETRAHYGDGLNQALVYANQALHSYEGGKELETFLDKSGLSANKTVLRFLNSVAKKGGGRR